VSSSRDPGSEAERRSTGLLRVPFVQRCLMEFDDGGRASALIVNINVLGAYIAHDAPPRLGQALSLRFGVPGNVREVEVRGAVAWVNRRQAHPVHSLPLGFGVRFAGLSDEARRRIETVVSDYVKRQGGR
jgi:Tfp pilus assembly protein PilZ